MLHKHCTWPIFVGKHQGFSYCMRKIVEYLDEFVLISADYMALTLQNGTWVPIRIRLRSSKLITKIDPKCGMRRASSDRLEKLRRSLAASARSIDVDVGEFEVMGDPNNSWGLVFAFFDCRHCRQTGKNKKQIEPKLNTGFCWFCLKYFAFSPASSLQCRNQFELYRKDKKQA